MLNGLCKEGLVFGQRASGGAGQVHHRFKLVLVYCKISTVVDLQQHRLPDQKHGSGSFRPPCNLNARREIEELAK